MDRERALVARRCVVSSSAPDRFDGIDACGADAASRPGRAHRTTLTVEQVIDSCAPA